MTIHGSDLPSCVLVERFLDGHRQRLVDHGMYGTRWECDCDEYREIKPLSPRAYCRRRGGMVAMVYEFLSRVV